MRIEESCPRCGKTSSFIFGEKILRNKLVWSASHTCSHCGYATEADDIGPMPQELRSLVLSEDGIWVLEGISTDAVALKAIHQVMGISLQEVSLLKK